MRIDRLWRRAGAALGGLGVLALTACGARAPVESGPPTPSNHGVTPAPEPTPRNSPKTTVVVGRPLRARRRLLAPDVGRGLAPLHADHRRLAAEPRRTELAALWLHAARMEHASVPAFSELALLLGAVGAPLDVVAAAHRAALDEVAHTEVSYALANAYGGTAHAPGPLPRLLGRRLGPRWGGRSRALRRLAVEALRDGCLNEGYAAALAAAGARSATDPAVRATLATIARDEAVHAALSWQVLGWALAEGGPDVVRAVARALRRLPVVTPLPTDLADLEPHGWPAPSTAALLYAGVRDAVTDRAADLLTLRAA